MDLDAHMDATERALLAAYRPRWWRRPEAELFFTALRHDTQRLLEDATVAAWDQADMLEGELRQMRAQMAEARKTIDLLRSHLAGGTRKVPAWSDAARELPPGASDDLTSATKITVTSTKREKTPGIVVQEAAREPATAPETPPGGAESAPEPRTPTPAGTGKGGSAQRRIGPRTDGAA